MKTDPHKTHHERLLADLYADDFDTAEHAARDLPLLQREFRLAYWRRKTTRVLLAAAALIMIGIFTSFYTRENQRDALLQTPALPTPAPHPQIGIPAQTAKPAHLTDEQLLALFPANSCFLAELGGKQILVFKDPKLARDFLE